MNSKISIDSAFKNEKALMVFITAGYPSIDATFGFIDEMITAGADLIAIGIPFSDPLAQASELQQADIEALSSGVTADDIFDSVEKRKEKMEVPIVLVSYLNPIFNYGYEKFFQRCEETGIVGIEIPDMPYEEREEIKTFAQKHSISIISVLAARSEERAVMIASEAQGFIHAEDIDGRLSCKNSIDENKKILKAVKDVSNIPIVINFDADKEDINSVTAEKSLTDGILLNKSIINIIRKYGVHSHKEIYEHIKKLKSAILNIQY